MLQRWLKQEYTAQLFWNWKCDDSSISFAFEFICMSRLEKPQHQSGTLSELMKRLRAFNMYHGKQVLTRKHPE